MKRLLVLTLLSAQLAYSSQPYTGSVADNEFIARELKVSPDAVARATAGHERINIQRAIYLTRKAMTGAPSTSSAPSAHTIGQSSQQQQPNASSTMPPATTIPTHHAMPTQGVTDQDRADASAALLQQWEKSTGNKANPNSPAGQQAAQSPVYVQHLISSPQETNVLGRLGTKSKHKKRAARRAYA